MTDSIINRMVQVGTITAVQGTKARVTFQQTGITSDWLPVLQRPGDTVSVVNNGLHTHTLILSEGTGTASSDGTHSHTASVTSWVPAIGLTVVVLYLPVFNSDGFIIGAVT